MKLFLLLLLKLMAHFLDWSVLTLQHICNKIIFIETKTLKLYHENEIVFINGMY